MAANPRWHIKHGKKKYVFESKLLTVGALTQIKAWYGLELGRYLSFISAFSQGDPEAALCALWLCRKAAGEEDVPNPQEMEDFSMDGFYEYFQPAGEEDPPTKGGKGTQTRASTPTPTTSEDETSDS